MLTDRRSFLAGGLSLLAGAAQAEDQIILRRPMRPEEDDRWYALGQKGPYHPDPTPAVLPLGQGRLVVHKPMGPKTGRLLVFSHGALNDPLVYQPLIQHWTSHGFVVAAPKHDDSILERGLLTRRASGVGSSVWEIDRVLNDANAWDARVEACKISLEHPDLLSKAVSMEVLVDRPIIVGHEFGAFVAQLLLGATATNDEGRVLSFADPRWYAGCFLSCQGSGIMGLTPGSWQAVEKPFLLVQPGQETDFTGQGAAAKVEAFQRAKPGHKYLAWSELARRNLFIGPRAGVVDGRRDQALFEDMKAMTTAFLLTYAAQDESLFRALNSDWPDRASLGRLQTRRR